MSLEEQREGVWRSAQDRIEGNAAALGWIENLKGCGLLRRLAENDSRVATALLSQAISIVENAPYPAVRLAELAAHQALPGICDHLVVYRHSLVLVDWYGVFDREAFASSTIPEQVIQEFAEAVGGLYRIEAA